MVILSRNDPVSGMRVFRSAQHYGLPIERGVFTRGQSRRGATCKPLNANLFLSANEADVRSALEAGVPAARVYPHSARASDAHPNEVRIAFDGDAVLFSDEAERVFQRDGLDAFQAHERDRAATPLRAGPFKPLLEALHRLQREPARRHALRTALVTARSAPAHERAIRTLMDWNIEVDEAMFLGGLPKGEFLREFEPDFFFDDQTGHIENAAPHVPAGHVAAGIVERLTHEPASLISAAPVTAAARARSSTRTPPYSMRISPCCLQRVQRLVDALARQADEVAELLLRDAQQRRRRPGTAPGGTARRGCARRANRGRSGGRSRAPR